MHEVVFHAGWDPETKTVLQEDGSVWWSPGDEINIFTKADDHGGHKFVSNNRKDSPTAEFVGEVSSETGVKYIAVYPYKKWAEFDGEKLRITIPQKQEAKDGTFDKKAFVSIAESYNNNLYFKNVCGGFKFSVAHEGIKRVRFTNNSGKYIVGDCYVAFGDNEPKIVSILGAYAYSYIDVIAPDDAYFVPGKYYYAACFPLDFSDGMTITYFRETDEFKFKNATPFTVHRATFIRIYEKDSGLEPSPSKKFSKVRGDCLIPEGVERSSITEINFYTNNETVTDCVIECPGFESEFTSDAKVYLEQDGTKLNYYTSADGYSLRSGGGTFADCSNLKALNLQSFSTSECDNMQMMFRNCASLTYLDLSSFSTANVRYMNSMFENCSSLKNVNVSSFDTRNVEHFGWMFEQCESLEQLDLSSFSVQGSTSSMFAFCKSLKGLDLRSFKNLGDAGFMFQGCESLESIQFSESEPVECNSCISMFNNCVNLRSLNLNNFDTRNVNDMSFMFYGCKSLETLDLGGINTSNVTDMSHMFEVCCNLKSLDLSSFDTGKVATMHQMFENVASLTSLDLSNFNTSNVTDMCGMFEWCFGLISLDLSNFNTQNVEDMSFMFNACYGLEHLNISSFNTIKVKTMSRMFQMCMNLTGIDISSMNTMNVTDMHQMFSTCCALKTLDLSTFNISCVDDMVAMFQNCFDMRNLNLSNLNIGAVDNKDYMFYDFAKNSESCKITCAKETQEAIKTGTSLNEEYIIWNTGDLNQYSSIDFSADGEVVCLQNATLGNGINLVFLGDAYSDRLISDGSYDNDIKNAVNAFFDIEPYRSFKRAFNIYEVKTVSINETYNGVTAVDGYIGPKSEAGGSHEKVKKYVKKIIPESKMDNTLVVVILNQNTYAGTTYLFPNTVPDNDYGCGFAISYMPKGTSKQEFISLVQHEAGGHGFAKLADEYEDTSNGSISTEEKEYLHKLELAGWLKNIDTTSDTLSIKWKSFIGDYRYANEKIGAYQGGYNYPLGVWRPTENSIMRYNTDQFNAPSREAIYYRINKLAYGKEWTFSHEKFVEFDKNARAYTELKRKSQQGVHSISQLPSPVLVKSDPKFHNRH